MTVRRPGGLRGPVDWAELRRRVEAAGHALAGASAPSPERARQVLEARARALARPAAAPTAGDTLELLTFVLAGEVYAVESRSVAAVFPLGDLCLLPGAEPPVLGVTAWRGDLLTIVDLRLALGLSASEPGRGTVIVLGEERPEFGILAEAVRELVTLRTAEVREAPEGLARQRAFLRGLTADAVMVLDTTKLWRRHR